MLVKSALAAIIPIISMIQRTTSGTFLTCIRRINVYYIDSGQSSLVFNEGNQTVERPGMEAAVVFTAFSCLLSNVLQFLQSNSILMSTGRKFGAITELNGSTEKSGDGPTL